jgi:predicted DNA-binding protein (MmcQ/YjbR family)
MTDEIQTIAATLRTFALQLPGAYEEFPWGERVAKVHKKVFVFLGKDDVLEDGYAFGVKLPASHQEALSFSCIEPAGYGLGKSGWVTIRLEPEDLLPVDLLVRWIEESYRTIAPKRLVAQLDRRAADAAT